MSSVTHQKLCLLTATLQHENDCEDEHSPRRGLPALLRGGGGNTCWISWRIAINVYIGCSIGDLLNYACVRALLLGVRESQRLTLHTIPQKQIELHQEIYEKHVWA